MSRTGTIYVIAAASGTGKTSLVKVLVESLDHIITSISYTTRPKRANEQDGENYFFIGQDKFQAMVDNHEFLEYATVFDYYYGTSRRWIEQQLAQGLDIILEIDWQGAQQIRTLFPHSVTIFILPPSMQELRRRLENRNQDSHQTIEKRLLTAANIELNHAHEFDYLVVNDQFDVAVVDLRSIIKAHRLTAAEQLTRQQKLLAELTKNR